MEYKKKLPGIYLTIFTDNIWSPINCGPPVIRQFFVNSILKYVDIYQVCFVGKY